MSAGARASGWERYGVVEGPEAVGAHDEPHAQLVRLDDPTAPEVAPWMRWGPGPDGDPQLVMACLARTWEAAVGRGKAPPGLPVAEVLVQTMLSTRTVEQVQSVLDQLAVHGAARCVSGTDSAEDRWFANEQPARELLAARARREPM